MIDYLRSLLAARKDKADERGASAVEYGLLIAGIAAVIVTIVLLLGGVIQDKFQSTCDAIQNGGPAGTHSCTSDDGGTTEP